MTLGKFVKTPDEVKRYSVEYAEWLDTGEYLQSSAVTASPAGPIIDVQTIGANDTDISFFVTGGLSGKSYKIKTRITTTNGQVKEDIILLEIRSI
jgi:hypothetical protein